MEEDDEDSDIVFDRAGLLSTTIIKRYETKAPGSKLLRTFLLCAAFFGLGLCIAVPGPTLLDLIERTHTSTTEISRIYPGRSVGYLLGSIVSGLLFDKLNQYGLLSASLISAAIATAFVPWIKHLELMLVSFGVQGVALGFLDTGGNVLCLHMWGSNSQAPMQALHASFGVGAFVAPLVTEPLLALHASHNQTPAYILHPTRGDPIHKGDQDTTKSRFAYLIIAIILAVVSLSFMLNCICSRCRCAALPAESSHTQNKESGVTGIRFQLLFLLAIFYFLYVGLEVTFGGWVTTYATHGLQWPKYIAVYLNSLFWGTFAITRILSVPLAKCLSATVMVILDMIISLVALIILACFRHPHNPNDQAAYAVWFSVGLLGVGLATIFPSGLTWAERYLNITGPAASFLIVGSALGEMLVPSLVGWLFQRSPSWLIYTSIAVCVMALIIYIVLQNLALNNEKVIQKKLLELLPKNDIIDAELDEDTDDAKTKKKVSFRLPQEQK